MAEDLEAVSWGRIHSVSVGLDCFVLRRRKRSWFEWRRSFGNVFGDVFVLAIGEVFYCMLGILSEGSLRFVRSSL